MQEITLVTGNLGKWKIAKDIFDKYNINLLHEKINTPEIQSNDVIEVSKYSALYAAKKLNKPVIKSDVGYYIEELRGFPGPFLKYVNDMLASEDILNMMKTKNNRKIYLKECLTYAEPNGFTKEFLSIEKTTLATKEAGNGSTFDKIVIFEGEKHPKSLNSEKDNYEHFKKTLDIYDDCAKYLMTREKETEDNCKYDGLCRTKKYNKLITKHKRNGHRNM